MRICDTVMGHFGRAWVSGSRGSLPSKMLRQQPLDDSDAVFTPAGFDSAEQIATARPHNLSVELFDIKAMCVVDPEVLETPLEDRLESFEHLHVPCTEPEHGLTNGGTWAGPAWLCLYC